MPLKTAHKYTVPYLQILSEKGVLDKKLDPGLDDVQLLRLYRSMVMAREADQRMLRLQRQGRMGTFSPSTGQEASACGPMLAMTERDWLVPAFRELGAMLMRGVPLHRVLQFWGGFEEGNVFPGVERTLPIAVIVASQIPHAAGIAYSLKLKNEKNSVLCYFGDGATSQGDFHEGLNFAAVWKAPVVYICQNNHWAISTPQSKQTGSETFAQKALAYGIPGIKVDGNDPLAMYQATRDALDRIEAGEGPTMIEALTYRVTMHTTADDPSKYRDEDEVKVWLERDPLTRTRALLDKKGLWDDDKQEELLAEVKKEIDAEVRLYEQGIQAKVDICFDHVHAEPTAELEEQRKAFLEAHGGGQADG